MNEQTQYLKNIEKALNQIFPYQITGEQSFKLEKAYKIINKVAKEQIDAQTKK